MGLQRCDTALASPHAMVPCLKRTWPCARGQPLSMMTKDNTPEEIYELAQRCCYYDATQRPTFKDISDVLSQVQTIRSINGVSAGFSIDPEEYDNPEAQRPVVHVEYLVEDMRAPVVKAEPRPIASAIARRLSLAPGGGRRQSLAPGGGRRQSLAPVGTGERSGDMDAPPTMRAARRGSVLGGLASEAKRRASMGLGLSKKPPTLTEADANEVWA